MWESGQRGGFLGGQQMASLRVQGFDCGIVVLVSSFQRSFKMLRVKLGCESVAATSTYYNSFRLLSSQCAISVDRT